MQMLQMIVKLIKQNKALLEAYSTSLKLELALLNCLQVTCYEDSKLLKVRLRLRPTSVCRQFVADAVLLVCVSVCASYAHLVSDYIASSVRLMRTRMCRSSWTW